MPSDYISREAARPDAFCEGVSCQECPFLKNSVTGGCRVDDFIKAIPAADVRPVKIGHYVTDEMGDSSCSECGEKYLDITKRFCPECGAELRRSADMREASEDG